jgi:hypothetical protein
MVAARRARRSGTRRHKGVEQRAAQGAVMSGGARGAFIYSRGEGAEAVGVGARAAATDGTVSSGGGNGGKGKWQGRGEDGAAAPFRVEWRGVGGEPVAGGE